MSEKKKSQVSPKISKVSRVITQARESLKLLETLEKETLAKAKNFVRNPIKIDRKNFKSDASLLKLQSNRIEALERRVELLEETLAKLQSASESANGLKRASKAQGLSNESTAESFPNT